jgi:hypothetical protein
MNLAKDAKHGLILALKFTCNKLHGTDLCFPPSSLPFLYGSHCCCFFFFFFVVVVVFFIFNAFLQVVPAEGLTSASEVCAPFLL